MILNRSKGVEIAKQERYAESLWTRFRGLIGRNFDSFDAMVFRRCSAVHTFFMGRKIDILFLDPDGIALGCYSSVPPWKCCIMERGAAVTIELPAGTLAGTETEPGDFIILENVS